MRVIVVGDIHGNDKKFRVALKSVGLKRSDKLILIGDLIDRGKDSKGVLDTLILLKQSGFEDIIYIRGNHEQMLLDAYRDPNKEYIWLKNGGDKTLQSFRIRFCDEIPQSYIELIDSSVMYYRYEKYIFVHAGMDFSLKDPLSDHQSLMWIRDLDEEKYSHSVFAGKTIVHGHTPSTKTQILNDLKTSTFINVDNGIYLDKEGFGSLAVFDVSNANINFI